MTETNPAPAQPRFAGPGWRLGALAALILLMAVPLQMISFVIEDRVSYQRSATRDVSEKWGGPVNLAGPVMLIPVEVERDRVVEDENGVRRTETVRERGAPVLLMPERLDISAAAQTQVRRRGIFDVPVYNLDLAMRFHFDPARVAGVLDPRETVLWDKATLSLGMPRTRSFGGPTTLKVDGRQLDLEPGAALGHGGGIQATPGDPRRATAFSLDISLNGAHKVMSAPTGRLTVLEMTSDWPHPSFAGAFLPKMHAVTAAGFTARWEIPHLARDIAQVSRGAEIDGAHFGVRLYNPVDIYQKVQRAAKYGILCIALTFLTVFLTERLAARRAHPAQFVLIGIAQCSFFLLLLSFAEQIGFAPAYVAASGATIGLISFYGRTGLALGSKWWVLAGSLVVLYATLFLILRSTDYALLAGSVLAFIALALVMALTRREDWSRPLAPVSARPAAPVD